MYVAKENMEPYVRENLRGGNGAIGFLRMMPEEEQPAKCRLYSILTLEKGCSIGWHAHDDETEIYYILEGEAETNDNGTVRIGRRTLHRKQARCAFEDAGGGHQGLSRKSRDKKGYRFRYLFFE